MPIKETGFFISDMIKGEFTDELRMLAYITKELSLNEVIRLRNFLTEEIERVQKPIAEMLDKVGGNVSPEI